eukprot:TRINITY_DN1891_c0_g1_i1.p1 TRINITY_DN1891_c0_g1~~TRINITY_DN1891_c0_g1_i1.p1  ORF type:complete len:564 (-),score=108.88 TRINITY_DN1891_c0_g1_i1:53-1567(-)
MAKDGSGDVDVQAVMICAVSVFCIVMPMELGQITFAVVGAVVYAGVQAMRSTTKAKLQARARSYQGKSVKYSAVTRAAKPVARNPNVERQRPFGPKNVQQKPEYRQPSVQPVAAPSFSADSFDVQVSELVELISPSPQSDMVMRSLAAAAKKSLQGFLPGADVVAFASGDVMRGTAFGVAVPEVDIILNAQPAVLAERLRGRTARPLPRAAQLDAKKLQKSALRACTDELVAGGIFKFRRSAFKGTEPKVTLLATGFGSQSIPVDFSVNTVNPFYNTALLTECGQIDQRAKDLILLARRWAKDRGVSHAAKGHLSPYAWTLLVVYYMQVREDQDGPSLKNLKAFSISSQDRRSQQQQPKGPEEDSSSPCAEASEAQKSVASLFRDFFRFYSNEFDWRNEAVSVFTGKRSKPSSRLPLHIVELEDGRTAVAPSIEDPFEPVRNVASHMTAMGVMRLKEELNRANGLCSENASLSKLLEPWVPPDFEGHQKAETNEHPSGESGVEA